MRLIDADALLTRQFIHVCHGHECPPTVHVAEIENAPTVEAVAVVRCRECANRNTCDCPLAYAVQWGIGNDEPSDDDFCSYGERKEPADDL